MVKERGELERGIGHRGEDGQVGEDQLPAGWENDFRLPGPLLSQQHLKARPTANTYK